MGEDGSAVVEFVMVVGLLLFLVVGVIEVALLLHVRDVITADAAEGARYEASATAATGSGGTRAKQLVDTTLGFGVQDEISRRSVRAAGVVAVTCSGIISLPLLPVGISLSQTGHALLEQR